MLAGFAVFVAGSLCLAPFIGRDFFPTVDSGQMRLHARAPAGTRIEETESVFAAIEREIRQVIPPREIDTIIDNIGIPNGGFNLAFGDNPTLGTGDGDILISLKPEEHGPTAEYTDRLRKRLHAEVPRRDVLLRGRQHHQPDSELRPARAHRRAGGGPQRSTPTTRSPRSSRAQIARIPGAADVHIHQVVDWPEIDVNVDRDKAGQVGLTQTRRQQQPADLADLQRPDRAHPVAGLAHRRQLLRRRADAAIPHEFAWRR